MKVSNSMIMSGQKCERRFKYEHVYQIRPKEFPEAMERGIAGHGLMEAAFLAMQEGKSYEECVEAVNLLLPELLKTPSRAAIYRHVLAFLAFAFQQEWKVISVEVSMMYPLGEFVMRDGVEEEVEFAFTGDVIFQWTTGPRKGYNFIVDFKFTGQYWTDAEIAVYQQLPKYVIYTNKMTDYNLRHAALVMLNTRAAATATGQNLYMMKWIDLNKHKLETIEAENIELSLTTAEMRVKGEAGTGTFPRSVDTYGCKMCFFKDDLCPGEMAGRDMTKTIERNYIKNKYFEENYEVEAE